MFITSIYNILNPNLITPYMIFPNTRDGLIRQILSDKLQGRKPPPDPAVKVVLFAHGEPGSNEYSPSFTP
jgi:hypothetical protein